MKQYKARSGKLQYVPSFEEIEAVIQGDNNEGFCLACGQSQMGVEPDAGKLVCESCDQPKVYGAEQLLLMGLHH